MKTAVFALVLMSILSAAPGTQTFTGTISDDMCASADHSRMQMGSNDAECATACVGAHGAAYVLYDGKKAYRLRGGPAPERFAGKKVRVTGALDAKTQSIRVDSIAPVK